MYVWYSTELFDFGSMRFSQKCLGRNKFEPPDEYDCHRGELDRSTIHRYGVGTCCSSPSTTMPCQVSGRPCNATLDQNCLRFLRAQDMSPTEYFWDIHTWTEGLPPYTSTKNSPGSGNRTSGRVETDLTTAYCKPSEVLENSAGTLSCCSFVYKQEEIL